MIMTMILYIMFCVVEICTFHQLHAFCVVCNSMHFDRMHAATPHSQLSAIHAFDFPDSESNALYILCSFFGYFFGRGWRDHLRGTNTHDTPPLQLRRTLDVDVGGGGDVVVAEFIGAARHPWKY